MTTQQPLKPQLITPQYVLSLKEPTKQYLCPLSANIYGVQFISFKIRNYQDNFVLCQISKKPQDIGKPITQSARTVRYYFGPYFFYLQKIGTTLGFRVGTKPMKDFKIIQRHYFRNKLLKSYQFTIPFCPPNSSNTLQSIYDVPDLTEQDKKAMIQHPWETISDSFYFVQNKLIMHNKAQFSYSDNSSQI